MNFFHGVFSSEKNIVKKWLYIKKKDHNDLKIVPVKKLKKMDPKYLIWFFWRGRGGQLSSIFLSLSMFGQNEKHSKFLKCRLFTLMGCKDAPNKKTPKITYPKRDKIILKIKAISLFYFKTFVRFFFIKKRERENPCNDMNNHQLRWSA